MSVTAEQVDAVRAAMESAPAFYEYEDASGALVLFAERLRFADEVAAHPHAGLARDMYERSKDERHPSFDLQDPKNGRYWLKAASAAFDVLIVDGKREPRVFNVGDSEPEDRDTITLRGTSNGNGVRPAGRELTFKFGDHSSAGDESRGGEWWQVTEDRHTHARWSTWLEKFGPLTEVLA